MPKALKGLSKLGKMKELFFYKVEVVRTTWILRITVLVFFLICCLFTGRWWLLLLGNSLIHEADDLVKSDVIVVESFETPFLPGLARAVRLQAEGFSPAILVLRLMPRGKSLVSSRFLKQMWESYCRAMDIRDPEVVALKQVEPVTLNMAKQLAATLTNKQVQSVTLISGVFHSKRSCLAYREVLEPLGIRVRCLSVSGSIDPDHWWKTSHDTLYVVEEFLKLLYYRIFVLTG